MSNDNPYSEAQFKTMKYCPAFPERFGCIHDARAFCADVLHLLQPRAPPLRHRLPHARLGALRHRSEVRAQRAETLEAAYAANPTRFGHRARSRRSCRPWPGSFKQLNHLDRTFARLARRAPIVLRCIATCLRSVAKHAGGALVRTSVRGQPSNEAKAVREQGRWFPQVMAEGTSNPRGVVDEYLAIAAPWGFLPEDVTTPVRIFQGTADTLVPEEWAELLTRRTPNASLALYPDEGHFIALTRRQDVLEWLAGLEHPSKN